MLSGRLDNGYVKPRPAAQQRRGHRDAGRTAANNYDLMTAIFGFRWHASLLGLSTDETIKH
jgi:hypothetical protein